MSKTDSNVVQVQCFACGEKDMADKYEIDPEGDWECPECGWVSAIQVI